MLAAWIGDGRAVEKRVGLRIGLEAAIGLACLDRPRVGAGVSIRFSYRSVASSPTAAARPASTTERKREGDADDARKLDDAPNPIELGAVV